MEGPFELEDDREIMRLKVIANGRQQEIVVRGYDQPMDLARAFCIKHGLNGQKCMKIALYIQENIERLIEEQEKQEWSQIDQEEEQEQQSVKPSNIGEELYQKGVDLKFRQIQQAQQVQLERIQKEKEEFTFKPSINNYTSTSRVQPRNKGMVRSATESHTFKPLINSKSKALDQQKGKPLPRFQQLYSLSKAKNQKPPQQKTERKVPLSSILSSASRMHDVSKQRQVNKQLKQQEKQEKMNQYFSPKIGRAPKIPRNQQLKSIGDHLYSQQPVKSPPISPGFRPSTSAYSSLLLSMKKKKAIFQIFRALQPSSDGRIYYTGIQFENLPEYIQRILAPFFQELKQVPQGLSRDDFSVAMDNLMRILNPTQRNEIINPKKVKKTPQQLPQEKHPQRIGTLYQRCVDNSNKTDKKISKQREKLVKKQISECTFKPATTKYKPKKSITKKIYEKEQPAHHCISHLFSTGKFLQMETFQRLAQRQLVFQVDFDICTQTRKRTEYAVKLRKAKRLEQTQKYRKKTYFVDVSTQGNGSETSGFQMFGIRNKLIQISNLLTQAKNSEEKRAHFLSIKGLVLATENFPFYLFLQYGFLPQLVSGLKNSQREIQEEASWLLCNIASAESTVNIMLMQFKVDEICLQVLNNKGSQEFIDNILWCLGNLAGESLRIRKTLLAKNTLQILVSFLLHQDNLPIVWIRTGFRTLKILVRDKQILSLNKISYLLDCIKSYLNILDFQTLQLLIEIMSYISDGDQERIDLFMSKDIQTFILNFIPCSKEDILYRAIITIGNLLAGNIQSTYKLLNLGVLDNLHSVIKSENSCVRKEVFWAVSNIAGGSPQQIRLLLDHSLAFNSFQGLLDERSQIREEASWILVNITRAKDDDLAVKLIEMGILRYLTQAFDYNRNEQLFLSNLLSFSHDLLRIAQSEFRINIQKEFEEQGCKEAIELVLFQLNSKNLMSAQEFLRIYFPSSPAVYEPNSIQVAVFDIQFHLLSKWVGGLDNMCTPCLGWKLTYRIEE